MQITGNVVDSVSGKVIPNVTVWVMAADGRSANVAGNADAKGAFTVGVPDNLMVMFSADNYTSASFQPYAILEDNVIRLDPDGTMTATIKFPPWLWIVLGFGVLYMSDKKTRRKYFRGDRYEHDRK